MGRQNSKFVIPSIAGIAAICLVCLCVVTGAGLYFYGDQLLPGNAGPATPVEASGVQPQVPPTQPLVNATLPEWTIIYYSAADDDVLEETMWFDINEMELVGSTSQVNIVVEMDRYDQGFDGDGDWSDTRRFLIAQDGNLGHIASPVIESIGEADMGDPQTLVEFATWAIQNYPAKKYALILSDHGGGWTGGFTDKSAPNSGLSIPDMITALEQIRQNTGIDKFELIGFDACLMAQIEVFGSLYPYSNYLVASEEIIPGYGWSYAAWMRQVADNPAMDGSEFAKAIVSTYVVGDSYFAELRATQEDIDLEEAVTTLSGVESARIPEVIDAMNQFVNAMAAVDQTKVAQARTYTRSYYSLFGEDVSPSFIDLGHFSQVAASLSGDAELKRTATLLQEAIAGAVVTEKNGDGMSGSSGIAFHFPDSDVYYLTEFNTESPPYYAESAYKFLEQSVWDEFLAYYYTGQEFVPQEGEVLSPPQSADITSPGASEMTVGPIVISDTEISGDETVNVSTTVSGNIAYIYTVLYYWDPDSETYWVGDKSYYIAENTTDIGGVNMPDYGPSPITVQYEWSPSLYAMTDGSHDAFVLLEPYEYLSSDGRTIYQVYGQYTSVLNNTPVDASLFFDSEGDFLYAYAFPDADGNGASTPVEIAPQIGDKFTDYVQFITFDENDNATYENSLSEDVFTWGEEGFSFFVSYPADGDYAVGIIAYDFDNNSVSNFEFITYRR